MDDDQRVFMGLGISGFVLFLLSLIFSPALQADSGTVLGLERLARRVTLLESRIAEKNRELKDEVRTERQKKQIETDLDDLMQERDRVRRSFLEVAVDQSLEGLLTETPVVASKREISEEFQDLVSPLLSSIRRVSARPRKIEQLKGQLAELEGHREILRAGKLKIEAVLAGITPSQETRFPDIKAELLLSQESLEQKKGEVQFRIEEIERKLKSEIGQERSMIEAVSDLVGMFFKERGRNLLLALLLAVLILWACFKCRRTLLSRVLIKPKYHHLRRPIEALFTTFSVTAALAGLIVTLYILNDWALVTFFLLFLLAAVWSVKQFFPKFLNEVRLLMNLSAVKEGERIVIQGLPWKVKTLGPYSLLMNEKLQGGIIRMVSTQLIQLSSRPWDQKEPWFPCVVGDWVELSDGTFGQVDFQSPEQVVLKTLSQGVKTLPVAKFLELAPNNFTHGFYVVSHLDLDYSHSEEILEGLMSEIQAYITRNQELHYILKESWARKFEVQVAQLTENAVRLRVQGDYEGRFAGYRLRLERGMNEVLLQFVNEKKLKVAYPHRVVQLLK